MVPDSAIRLTLVAALLPACLAAQGLPPLPPLAGELKAPTPGELVPLRPVEMLGAGEGAVPIRYWGKDVKEGPEGWTLDNGAVESPDMLLLADRISFKVATGELEAEGNIRLEYPGLRLRCARLQMDWKRKIGEAWALEMEIQPNWYLRSEKVAFNTLNHWDFQQVELSPCPQEQPGWKAKVSRLSVDLNRFATIHNLWIWLDNVPTPYYLPWAMYPAKAERTSGVLPVSLSFSGPMGASLIVPYYQVLGETADVTVSPEYFARQGFLWGAEARWNPEPTHAGSFTGEFIKQRMDDEHRYRFTLKELWQREDGWQLAADVNRASDALLDADYGQGLARLGGTPYDSALYLGKNFPWASFSMASSEQMTYFTRGSEEGGLYNPNLPNSLRRQVLPSFQAALYPLPLGSFYFDGGVRVGRMTYKLDVVPVVEGEVPNDTYAWRRGDAFLRLQGRLGQWGPLRADLETLGRFTRYSNSLGQALFDTSNRASNENLDFTTSPFLVDGPGRDRLVGSARLQLSAPPMGRTYKEFKLLGYVGELKHVMNPYVALICNTKASAEGWIPHFDEVDASPGVANSATGERSVELGVKQHFLGRAGVGSIFQDLVRWKVSAKFHMQPILLNDGRVLKGWGTVDNEIDMEPNDALRISFRRSSTISDNSSDQSLSADYKTGDGTRFNLAYFSTGINKLVLNPQRGVQVGGLKRLWSDQFRLEFKANYDSRLKEFAGSQVALAYVTPCVAWSLRYSHIGIQVPGSVTKEDRLDLAITLRSLGDLGKYTF